MPTCLPSSPVITNIVRNEHSAQWDAALALCAGRPVSTRPLALRWQGARRLQKWQMVAFAVQLAVLACLLVNLAR
jgi:hypothetical protein